jgi:hypothetical protein
MTDPLAVLRAERERLVAELKKVERAIRALGGGRRGRPPSTRGRARRRKSARRAGRQPNQT